MLPNVISDITKSHIDALLTDGISENHELDYKRELPEGPDRRIGFLKDVTAFANTSGGDLVFGIEEERNSEGKHTGRAARILGVKGLDDNRKIKLEQWIRAGIEPRVYVQLCQIDGYPDGPVLVVRVQKSWVGPHMVKDEFRFWARANQGNFEMNALQVREAVLTSQSVAERVATFCHKRTQEMQTEHATIPLVPEPAMVLHVVPIASLSRNDIDLQLAKGAVLPLRGGGNERFNLDGWVVEYPSGPHIRSRSYVQVFRNGAIEGVACYGDRNELPGLHMLRSLNSRLAQYISTIRKFGLPPPYSVHLTVIGARGRHIAFGDPSALSHELRTALDRDVLVLPSLWLEEADCHKPIESVWQPVFDVLAQATNRERCPYYNSSNEWTGGSI